MDHLAPTGHMSMLLLTVAGPKRRRHWSARGQHPTNCRTFGRRCKHRQPKSDIRQNDSDSRMRRFPTPLSRRRPVPLSGYLKGPGATIVPGYQELAIDIGRVRPYPYSQGRSCQMSATLELALNPHQELIDVLNAWNLLGAVDRLSSLLITRDAQAGVCPSCGDNFKDYRIVPQGAIRGLYFRHPGHPSCFMDFSER